MVRSKCPENYTPEEIADVTERQTAVEYGGIVKISFSSRGSHSETIEETEVGKVILSMTLGTFSFVSKFLNTSFLSNW